MLKLILWDAGKIEPPAGILSVLPKNKIEALIISYTNGIWHAWIWTDHIFEWDCCVGLHPIMD